MCWVMPPASVSTTADSRIASRRVVLPWSTWPMIVTTGGRSLSSSAESSKVTSSASSSAAWLDRDLTLELAADQLDGLVAQRLRDLHHLVRRHQERDDLRRRDAELLGEVLDGDPGWDLDGTGRHLRLAALLLARCAPFAPLARTAAGLRVDHDTAAAARRCPTLWAGMAAGLAGVRLGGGGLLAVDAPRLVVVDDVGHGPLGGGLGRSLSRGVGRGLLGLLGLLRFDRLLRHYVNPSTRPSGRSNRTCSARSAGRVSEHFSLLARAPRRPA